MTLVRERLTLVGVRRGPTVGLLLTTYNSARFIDQTLASIATQTRSPDQIVLVDDASTDDTARRARMWQSHLPLEVVVQPRNGGVSRARNAGAKRLGTDLVAILDGDDVVLPDHLEILTDLHHRQGGIVAPRALFWVPGQRCTPYQRRLRGLNPPRTRQLQRLIQKNYVFVASMVSRKDFELVGGYHEGPRHHDMTSDWDLWLRMVAAGSRVSQAPVPTVLYRVLPGSMADGTAHLVESEILQLQRTRALVPNSCGSHIDRAIRHRQAQLAMLARSANGERLALARMALGSSGGDPRNRLRALSSAIAPQWSSKVVGRRGVW